MERSVGSMERVFGASKRLQERLLESGEMRLRLAVLEREHPWTSIGLGLPRTC